VCGANRRGRSLEITVSIGPTQLEDGDLRAAIRKSDIALYRAKALGRNRVCRASEETAGTT
jgi:PleD family two-component response regulator